MPFTVETTPGFDGRFALVPTPGTQVTDEQRAVVERFASLMNRLDRLADLGTPKGRLRAQVRAAMVGDFRNIANDFALGRLTAEEAIRSTYVYQGRLEAALERIAQAAFTVEEIDADGNVIPRGSTTPASDLLITVRNAAIPTDKLNFKVELDRTLTVVKVVLRPGMSGVRDFVFGTGGPDTVRRRSHYIHQLAGIGGVGLEGEDPSMTTLARQSLASLQEEFVAMEAGTVKNGYLRRLGWRCLLAAALATFVYVLIRRQCPIDYTMKAADRTCPALPVPFAFRNFFLLLAGAAVGTWLSFSLRRVILTFLDLAKLEEDQLDPTNRILFVTALATVAGLLFWTGATSVGIGTFQSDVAAHGAGAALIGLLLGIAERALATAVYQRAGDFAGGGHGR